MAKALLSKRSPAGMAVKKDTIEHVCQSLKSAEKHHARNDSETLRLSLILGAMYRVVEDHEEAIALLTRYVAAAKKQQAPNVAEMRWAVSLLAECYFELGRIPEGLQVISEGRSLSGKIDSSAKDPLLEGFLQLALRLETKGDTARVRKAFAAALMGLCLCITCGFHRTSSGSQVLERLHSSFKSYGLGDEEWVWAVKHAHLTKYDFVGLLSFLLQHTDPAPSPLAPMMRRRPRVIEVR